MVRQTGVADKETGSVKGNKTPCAAVLAQFPPCSHPHSTAGHGSAQGTFRDLLLQNSLLQGHVQVSVKRVKMHPSKSQIILTLLIQQRRWSNQQKLKY